MPNCWVDWPAPVPNAAMLFKVMDALPTPRRRLFVIPMRRGAESVAPPGHHPEWDEVARVEPIPQKVRDLLDQGPRPGVGSHS